jgi:hypothetical protein
MPSVIEATATILAAPAPVLLVDTCSLVDVIRAPKRHSELKGCVPSAVELHRMVSANPPECHLVVGSFVREEWTKHSHPTADELQRHLDFLAEASQHVCGVCWN